MRVRMQRVAKALAPWAALAMVIVVESGKRW
jgi:hypothetical protein